MLDEIPSAPGQLHAVTDPSDGFTEIEIVLAAGGKRDPRCGYEMCLSKRATLQSRKQRCHVLARPSDDGMWYAAWRPLKEKPGSRALWRGAAQPPTGRVSS